MFYTDSKESVLTLATMVGFSAYIFTILQQDDQHSRTDFCCHDDQFDQQEGNDLHESKEFTVIGIQCVDKSGSN